jgi:hypothetical protein
MKDAIRDMLAKLKEAETPLPRPASAKNLKRAEKAGFPAELLNFYRLCEPDDCIELKQRIWSIESAIVENTDAVPGCVLYPHGFIVFASTLCGDPYCIDTTVTTAKGHHPVVLFSHEMIEEDATLPDIRALRRKVASSLEDFLKKFVKGTLTEEPSYG